MDDAQIIEMYSERDERAIFETSAKYGSYCFSVANNILGSAEDSEECVNDTWLRAWNSIPPQRPKYLRLFLAKITRNLAFNRYKEYNRLKRGGREIEVALEEISEIVSTIDSPEQAIDEAELACAVNRFLRTISDRERNIFIRRYFFTESTKIIADRNGLTEDNALRILSRVRNKLKKYLVNEGYQI